MILTKDVPVHLESLQRFEDFKDTSLDWNVLSMWADLKLNKNLDIYNLNSKKTKKQKKNNKKTSLNSYFTISPSRAITLLMIFCSGFLGDLEKVKVI